MLADGTIVMEKQWAIIAGQQSGDKDNAQRSHCSPTIGFTALRRDVPVYWKHGSDNDNP